MKKNDKLIFLDIDGVMTSINDGSSYLSCEKAENYHLSERCINNLKTLIEKTDAKIVLTTNWTRLESIGRDYWVYDGQKMYSLLPKLREIFSDVIIGMIPPEKGLKKSMRTILWFEDNNYDISFSDYVIFDDDSYEEYQNTTDYGINRHFIMTDENIGFSEEDVKKAIEILV